MLIGNVIQHAVRKCPAPHHQAITAEQSSTTRLSPLFENVQHQTITATATAAAAFRRNQRSCDPRCIQRAQAIGSLLAKAHANPAIGSPLATPLS